MFVGCFVLLLSSKRGTYINRYFSTQRSACLSGFFVFCCTRCVANQVASVLLGLLQLVIALISPHAIWISLIRRGFRFSAVGFVVFVHNRLQMHKLEIAAQGIAQCKVSATRVVVDELQISPVIVNGFENGFHQWIQRIFLVVVEAKKLYSEIFFKFGSTLRPCSG